MQEKLLIKTYTATATITRRRAVELVTNGAAQANAETDFSVGISHPERDAAANERVDVVQAGITEFEAGAAVALGAFLTADAMGRGITATTGNRVIAMALEAATVAGDIIRVQIIHTNF